MRRSWRCRAPSSRRSELAPRIGCSMIVASPAWSTSSSPVKISRIAAGSLKRTTGGVEGSRIVNGSP
jgi:hypothetical protein